MRSLDRSRHDHGRYRDRRLRTTAGSAVPCTRHPVGDVGDWHQELAQIGLPATYVDQIESDGAERSRSRTVYRLAGSIIEIVAVGPRASIYEETWRRVRRDLSSR